MASTTGFPDATTTGVPSGIDLKPSGSMVINTPGAVIEGLDIKGDVVIDAPNVTLKNCSISSGSFTTVLVKPGITGTTIQNCDIDNQNSGGQGIAGTGTFINNNIHNAADGIDVRGDNTVIRDNFIHDMGGTADSHLDGIQADGSFSNITIDHNTIINEHGQTSAVMLDNYWGPIDNVDITNNLLSGGGYTVYINEVANGQPGGGPVTNVNYTNNHIDPGQFGPLDLRTELGHQPNISGNVNDGESLIQQLNMTGQPSGDGGDTSASVPPADPSDSSSSGASGSASDDSTGSGSSAPSGSASNDDTGSASGSGSSSQAGSGSGDTTGSAAGDPSDSASNDDSGSTSGSGSGSHAGSGSGDTTGSAAGDPSDSASNDDSGSTSGNGSGSQAGSASGDSGSAAGDPSDSASNDDTGSTSGSGSGSHAGSSSGDTTGSAAGDPSDSASNDDTGSGDGSHSGSHAGSASGDANGSASGDSASSAGDPSGSASDPTDPASGDQSGSTSDDSAISLTSIRSHGHHDKVTFRGTADGDAQIKLFDSDGGEVSGRLKTGDDGHWKFTTKLDDSHSVQDFVAKAFDSAGNLLGETGHATVGTSHRDTLESSSGDDFLTGGRGHDTFVFASDFGKDVISDFRASGHNHDVIQFSKSVFDNFADVLAHATQEKGHVDITTDGGDSVTLQHQHLSALKQGDFHFS